MKLRFANWLPVLPLIFLATTSSLRAQTTFSNTNPITINDDNAATPYPSDILVSGMGDVLTSITVTLTGLSDDFPDDIDMLLVGPGGQNLIIFSDVGGDIPASNVNITLDDSAAANVPDTGPLVSGTFKPTNGAPAGDFFFDPAPAASGATTLSVFNGTDPNGTWSLFVLDDLGTDDAGLISGGWSVSITAIPEPSTWILFGGGLAGMIARRYLRRHRALQR